MECILCKEEKELCINTEECRLCGECISKHHKVKVIELKNNVLSYIRVFGSCAPYNTVRDQCASEFDEQEILDAKAYLIANVKDELVKINEEETNDLMKRRQDSPNRTKAVA